MKTPGKHIYSRFVCERGRVLQSHNGRLRAVDELTRTYSDGCVWSLMEGVSAMIWRQMGGGQWEKRMVRERKDGGQGIRA